MQFFPSFSFQLDHFFCRRWRNLSCNMLPESVQCSAIYHIIYKPFFAFLVSASSRNWNRTVLLIAFFGLRSRRWRGQDEGFVFLMAVMKFFATIIYVFQHNFEHLLLECTNPLFPLVSALQEGPFNIALNTIRKPPNYRIIFSHKWAGKRGCHI